MGQDVSVFAPEGSFPPEGVKYYPYKCSYGAYLPGPTDCEQDCYNRHKDIINSCDIIHDFSINKTVTENLNANNKYNTICTLMGGSWTFPTNKKNIVVWTEAMKQRGLIGASDYNKTSFEHMDPRVQTSINDAHIVNGGVDTNFYTPNYNKDNYFLWMNRWHPAKGYSVAIELAKKTGIKLVMAGTKPESEQFEYQKNCALEAVEMAKGYSNITFEWLKDDPDHHTSKLKLYQNAKSLLYTVQFQEPFGLSQVESMSCGTPVLGINFGSVSEVIDNGLTGFCVENSLEALEEKLFDINQISYKTCRKIAVLRFDRSVMALNYLKEYNKILNNNGWG
jgi:glycosyltransferase involved in cell wall biosynthesis